MQDSRGHCYSNHSILKISIPEDLLFTMVQKAIENSGHGFLRDIANQIDAPIDVLKGRRPFSRYFSFVKLCRLAGFNEDQVLAKCDVTKRSR